MNESQHDSALKGVWYERVCQHLCEILIGEAMALTFTDGLSVWYSRVLV